MKRAVKEWAELNRDARRVCQGAHQRMQRLVKRDPIVDLCTGFISKAVDTLSAVNVLYANKLEEPAQSLIRVLFELRINFDCFRKLAAKDPREAMQKIVDSMMLEKVKQARASKFAGIPKEMQQRFEQYEKETARRYSEAELNKLRKHGFTGVPVEQRAVMTGHETAYSIVYRNFSRNIHGTDYMENYLKTRKEVDFDREGYRESRDIAAHYTAHFSAVGMVEIANRVFRLGMEKELAKLGERQREIKAMDGSADT